MGINIYARWKNQSDAQVGEQYEAFLKAYKGGIGYLREAYHGEPYATKYLCAEAFEQEDGEANIPAAVLESRLPRALELAEERERKIYKSSEAEIELAKQSFRSFVALCKQNEMETGEPVRIVAEY